MAKRKINTPNQRSLFHTEIPRMPEGYYSGDKPNPNLRKFVEEHLKERPYDPENDDYDVEVFNKQILATKIDPIYNIHPYDSKKSYAAVKQHIQHYTRLGDMILDPFCGSGSTLIAASSEGCTSIGIDFSPLATFISSEIVQPTEIFELQAAFESVAEKARRKIQKLYETRCHRCGGPAHIMGTVLSEKFQCLRCLDTNPFYACIPSVKSDTRLCPTCFHRGVESKITTSFERMGWEIVEIAFRCNGSCKPRRSKRSILDSDGDTLAILSEDITNAEKIRIDNLPKHLTIRMMRHSSPQER